MAKPPQLKKHSFPSSSPHVSFHHGANLGSPGTAGDTDDDGKNKVHTYFNRPQAPSLHPQIRLLSQRGRRLKPHSSKQNRGREGESDLARQEKNQATDAERSKMLFALDQTEQGSWAHQTPNQCHLGEIIRLNGRLANAEPES